MSADPTLPSSAPDGKSLFGKEIRAGIPCGWGAGPAPPEALEGPLRLVGLEATPLVEDAEPGAAVRLLRADGDPAPGRAVPAGVLDEVRERALEGAAVAAYDDGPRSDGLDGRIG